MEYLSKQKYDEISAELKHLITEVFPTVQEELAEASAQGDRSDNAGYREARRIQGKTISRIRFLQRVLEHSRVIDPEALPKDRVSLLSYVEFTNLQTQARMRFQIVSPHEMDLEAGKISLKSPIGAATDDAIDMLLTITEPSHILYGSDYPYVAASALIGAKKALEGRLAKHDLNPEDIFSDNAKLLFK